MGTALERSESETDLALKATSYEMAAWGVDGMDVLAVESAVRHAAEAVREGGEPIFLELRTYRFRAHSMYDPDLYRDRAEIEAYKAHDPIPALAARLEATEPELAAIEAGIAAEIDDAIAFAEAGTLEPVEDLERFVVCEGEAP
jgi:pyruvate dehydrogenase E1 component alpha subunit